MANLRAKSSGIIREFDIKKPSIKILYAVLFIISLLMVFFSVAPILWVFLSSFKNLQEFSNDISLFPKTYDFKGFINTWNQLQFVTYYINSFIVVAGSIVCAVVFNGLIAYVISRLKPKGSNIVEALVMWSLMIPSTVSVVPLLLNIVHVHLVGTFIPLWLAIGANAFFVVLYKSFYDSLPESLIEAARLDGCSDLQIFFRIVVPLSMAINVVIAMYAINAAWSDFLLPYLVLRGTPLETVMVRLFEFKDSRTTTDIDLIRAILFALIPPIILFSIFQRQIIQGVAQSGIKG
jgi:multiple sugar transport system permease protein